MNVPFCDKPHTWDDPSTEETYCLNCGIEPIQAKKVDLLVSALAAIIGFTGMPSDKPVDRVWVLKTALMGFGCDSLEEYIKMIKTGD